MVEKNVNLAKWNTMGLEVLADLYCEISDISTLQSIWKSTLIPQSNTFILGGGSNIVFQSNYHGLVLKNSILGVEILEDTHRYVLLKCGSGENWHKTVLWAVNQGFGGIENLSLIPGTIGAAPIQNIGAYGVELESVFDWLEAFDLEEGKVVKITKDECNFGYRDSIFKQDAKGRFFITSVVLKLNKTQTLHLGYGDIKATLEKKGIDHPTIADVSQAVIDIRQSKLPDPALIGNCGSFFKNPVIDQSQLESLQIKFPDIKHFPAGENMVKVPAAWLIETAGWKGFRRGDVGVHQRQALVLVNYGNGKGAEIYQLALDIQADVNQKFGIKLEMEVNVR